MGMLEDILNSIQNAGGPGGRGSMPGGGSVPAPSGQSGTPVPSGQAGQQGMSTMAKVLLALLAMYAVKNVQRTPSGQQPSPQPTGGNPDGGLGDILKGPLGGIFGNQGAGAKPAGGGGLDDLLKGPLGGIIGGAGAGALLNGGLDNLLKQLQQNGQGALVDSWVEPRTEQADRRRRPRQRARRRHARCARARKRHAARRSPARGLRQWLPRFVDEVTPEGRLPNQREWERMI